MTSVGDYRRTQIRDMSEAELQASVVDLAQRLGWRVAWIPDHLYRGAMTRMKENPRRGYLWSPPGEPDLRMVRGARVIFAELKKHGEKPRLPQQEWLDDLAAVPGVEVYLWKPEDWYDGSIEHILNAT
jgi:hypothetical protein